MNKTPSPSPMPWQPHVLENLKISEVTKWFGLMEGLNEGVIIQDSTTKVVAVNTAACKMLEIKPEQILDNDSRDLFFLGLLCSSGEPYPPGEDPSYTTLVTGRGIVSEYLGVSTFKDGTRWFIANFMPIWENGELDGMADGVITSFHTAPHNKFAIDHSALLANLASRQDTKTSSQGIITPDHNAHDVLNAADAGQISTGHETTRATNQGTESAQHSNADKHGVGQSAEGSSILHSDKTSDASLFASGAAETISSANPTNHPEIHTQVASMLHSCDNDSSTSIFQETFELATSGNLLLQLDGSISAVNRHLADLLERNSEQLIGMDWRTIVRPEDQHLFANYLRSIINNDPDPIVIRLFHNSGRAVQTRLYGFRINNKDSSTPPQYYLTFEEVTGRSLSSGMPSMETYDSLTGLPNRDHIIERISQSLQMAQRRRTKVAILHIDIDRFVRINNSLGHDIGDKLLIQVGKRIQATIRSHDTAGRITGDEFVVISEDISESTDAMRLADRISDSMRRPFKIDQETLTISTSIGIAFAEANDVPSQLLRRADMAMHDAKESGRDNVSIYNRDLQQQALQRLNIENEIRVAIPSGQMRLHHQPIIRLDDKSVVGTEALIRWEHPSRGLLTPYHFLGVAEESDLIVDIGKWVLEEASKQASLYNAPRQLHTAINISAKQLAEPDFVELVQQTLQDMNLPANQLVIELTETSLLQASPKTFKDIETLTDYGIRLAIDDFGTGYSSLTYLDRLPVSVVKIDRSFIKEMVVDERRRAITQAVIQLGQALNLEVIAEGIEEKSQSDMLESMGCDFAQGYLFGRPAPLEI